MWDGSVAAVDCGRSQIIRPSGAFGLLQREWGLVAVVAIALMFVLNAWTPSHYGEAARTLGIPRAGPLLGDSRSVRSDEWAVALPYFQIAVANDFGPRNTASPYRESLKAFFAMPSRDWSMAFKPSLWGFLLLDPAHAYALHYAVLAVAMMAGFSILLRQLGCSRDYALAISAILFLSQFVQAWWTTNAAAFAFAPWPFVLFLSRGSWLWRIPAMSYAVAVWLIGLMYPPFIVGSAIALTALVAAFRPQAFRIRSLLAGAAAAAAGGAIAGLHFSDLIAVMASTVFPGQRVSDGGGLPHLQVAAHFFPSLLTSGFEPLPLWPTNACEVAVVGSLLPLALAAFGDHRAVFEWAKAHQRGVAIWLAALGGMAAWMLLPIPAALAPGLNLVPPNRMLWGFGLLLLLGLAVVGSRTHWRLSLKRMAVFAAAVVAGWAVSKVGLSSTPLSASGFDLVVLPLLGLSLFAARLAKAPERRVILLALAATAALTFGRFNPVQSAEPIFAVQDSELENVLGAYAAANPKGWAVQTRHYGAVVAGAGVPAINHVLLSPQLEFFRRAYPSLEDQQFNFVFNRYAHVAPAMTWSPTVVQDDLVEAPPDPFAISLPVRVDALMAGGASRGAVDSVSVTRLGERRWGVMVEGRAAWSGVRPDQSVAVWLARPRIGRIVGASGFRLARPDIVAAEHDPSAFAAGFGLRLEVEGGEAVAHLAPGDIGIEAFGAREGRAAVRGCCSMRPDAGPG